jgi:hypothetical protein
MEDRILKEKLSKPYIAYLGAWEGCGCGFEYGLFDDPDEEDLREDDLGRESVQELRKLLESRLQVENSVELFVCWEGEQEQPVRNRVDITPAFFAGDSIELEPGTLFVVRQAA